VTHHCRVWGAALTAVVLSTTAASRANAQARTIANLVVGDAVMVVKAGAERRVYVGVGEGNHTSMLTAAAPAVDEFVAETQAVVVRGTRSLPPHVLERPELQDADSARTLSVTRHLDRQHGVTRVSYHFFVSDARLSGYVVPATVEETKAILLALHRAARAALAGTEAKATGPKKAVKP
jgi:hypothetical protein